MEYLGPGLAEGQEGCIGRRAVLPEGAVQVQRVRQGPRAGDGCREAQLIAVALVQGVLAGLHILHICVPGAVQLERPGLAASTSVCQHRQCLHSASPNSSGKDGSPSFTFDSTPQKCNCHLKAGGPPAGIMHAQLRLSAHRQVPGHCCGRRAAPSGSPPLLRRAGDGHCTERCDCWTPVKPLAQACCGCRCCQLLLGSRLLEENHSATAQSPGLAYASTLLILRRCQHLRCHATLRGRCPPHDDPGL